MCNKYNVLVGLIEGSTCSLNSYVLMWIGPDSFTPRTNGVMPYDLLDRLA